MIRARATAAAQAAARGLDPSAVEPVVGPPPEFPPPYLLLQVRGSTPCQQQLLYVLSFARHAPAADGAQCCGE